MEKGTKKPRKVFENFEKSAEKRIIDEIMKRERVKSAPSILFPDDIRYARWKLSERARGRVKHATDAYRELLGHKKKFKK